MSFFGDDQASHDMSVLTVPIKGTSVEKRATLITMTVPMIIYVYLHFTILLIMTICFSIIGLFQFKLSSDLKACFNSKHFLKTA